VSNKTDSSGNRYERESRSKDLIFNKEL